MACMGGTEFTPWKWFWVHFRFWPSRTISFRQGRQKSAWHDIHFCAVSKRAKCIRHLAPIWKWTTEHRIFYVHLIQPWTCFSFNMYTGEQETGRTTAHFSFKWKSFKWIPGNWEGQYNKYNQADACCRRDIQTWKFAGECALYQAFNYNYHAAWIHMWGPPVAPTITGRVGKGRGWCRIGFSSVKV